MQDYLFGSNLWIDSIMVFFSSFVLTYFVTPRIIAVVHYKQLMDDPNERSSHTRKTPTLGGIAFYITFIFLFFFIRFTDSDNISINIIVGLTIIFFTGLKDDLVILSPISKILAQLAAIAFILSKNNFLIDDLHGFLGIEEIPFIVSVAFSSFIMLVIINAYNLIDGIDGLAAIIGVVISSVYGVIFYMANNYYYALLCLSVIACLLAFLRYNLSSDKKIFMGDTGALIIGYMISIMTLKFLCLKNTELLELPFALENAPIIVISILIVPLFDTARVFAIRLSNKRSPFSADRNHIHHILTDLGFSHKKSSILIGLANFFFIILFVFLGSSSSNFFMILCLILIVAFLFYLFFILNLSFSNLKNRVRLKRWIDKNLKNKK